MESLSKIEWDKPSLEECVQESMQDGRVREFDSLPRIMIHNLWWTRNVTLFEDKEIPKEKTIYLVIKLSREYKMEPKLKKQRVSIMSHGLSSMEPAREILLFVELG